MKWFRAEIQSGSPVRFGSHQIVPRALLIQVRAPWINGGIIYNRPIAVQVQTGSGPTRTLPIINVTRLVQLYTLVFALLAAWLLWRIIKHD